MSSIFGLGGASTQQQPSNVFGVVANNQPKSNIFGTPSTGTSLFNQPASSTPQPQQGGSIFNTATSQPQQQTGGLFGAGGGLFGSVPITQQQGTSVFGQPQNQAAKPFGFPATASASNPQGGGIFGQPNNTNQQQGGGVFGLAGNTNQQQQGGSVFGQPQNQQQQGGGIFGLGGGNQQQQRGNSIFGQPQNQQQQQQQQQQQPGSIFGQSLQSRIWSEQEGQLRQRSVTDQIELIFSKWNPESPNSPFHTYLYNTYPADTAPFFRPDPSDNEEKWEEALRKRPNPGAIPFIVKGFQQLGQRIIVQEEHLRVLHGRLYEINNGLTDLLNKHDVSTTARTAECRRKHQVLAQKCLALATKTQILRNRGYAMDTAEEELRQKLTALERKVCDPSLQGRGEEIWARMVSVRERGRQLQFEMERLGFSGKGEEQVIDEETMKKARKILEDYNSQLAHLATELEQIRKEYEEWEASKPSANGYR
ncbi:hypothetical protein MMC30_007221 [Trapelia coarctata]|nr:hypothetical protein [Trapelia coarctata]